MLKQDPYFDDPNCESGYVNIETGQCVPTDIDIFNLPECSTGVYDEFYNCSPVGTGEDVEIVTPPLPVTETYTATVGVDPLSVELPATGPGDVAMVSGALGSLLIISGIILRYLSAQYR